MKKTKQYLTISLLALVIFFSSFTTTHKQEVKFPTYFWFTPAGNFLDHNTLGGEEVTTGFDTNATNGTLQENGYTGITADNKPAGTLAFKLYSHP